MEFYVYGPFKMIRNSETGLIAHDATSKKRFWESVEEQEEGLSSACGCFVFAMSAGGGKRPWYVGKAERQNFRKECFQPHKINNYNSVVAKQKGKPYLYFIAKVTRSGSQFSKPKQSKSVDKLESMITGLALSRNKELLNLNGTKHMRELIVHGIINAQQGNPGNASLDLKKTLGMN